MIGLAGEKVGKDDYASNCAGRSPMSGVPALTALRYFRLQGTFT